MVLDVEGDTRKKYYRERLIRAILVMCARRYGRINKCRTQKMMSHKRGKPKNLVFQYTQYKKR